MPRSSTSSPQNIFFALLVLFWFFFLFYFGWLTTLSSICTRKGMCIIVLDHVMYLGKNAFCAPTASLSVFLIANTMRISFSSILVIQVVIATKTDLMDQPGCIPVEQAMALLESVLATQTISSMESANTCFCGFRAF